MTRPYGPLLPGTWFWPGTQLSEMPLGLDRSRPKTKLERIRWICPRFAAQAHERIADRNARARRAQEQRAANVGIPDSVLTGRQARDVGPGHQHRRERLEVAEVKDTEHGQRKVGRVRDPLARMARRGEISLRQHRASMLFLNDVEDAQPALRSGLDFQDGRAGGSTSRSPMPIPVWSQARVQAALRAAGVEESPVLVHVLIERRSLDAFARQHRMAESKPSTLLRRALDRLADHYRLPMAGHPANAA